MPELFPYGPNWQAGITERLAWLTDVFESHNATESRIALRSKPRRTLTYTILRADHDTQELDALLWQYQATQFVLPIWTDPQRLTSTLPQASNSIPADTNGYDFEARQWLVLMHGQLYQALLIDQVNANSLDLVNQTLLEWPPGTLLYPGRLARLPADVSTRRLTSTIAEASLEFEIEPSSGTAIESPDAYNGLPVHTEAPNWARDISADYSRKLQRIDYQAGTVYIDDLSAWPMTTRAMQFTHSAREAIKNWRGWLHARAGQANAYWQPQWQHDLTQTAPIGSASDQLTVRAVDYVARYNSQPGRKHLAIRHRSGAWYFREITGASISGDNETLTLDQPLGIDADPGELMIAWLNKARLNDDEITIKWQTTSLIDTVIQSRGLRA